MFLISSGCGPSPHIHGALQRQLSPAADIADQARGKWSTSPTDTQPSQPQLQSVIRAAWPRRNGR